MCLSPTAEWLSAVMVRWLIWAHTKARLLRGNRITVLQEAVLKYFGSRQAEPG